MKAAADEYLVLMNTFLHGEMPSAEFQLAYIEKFKNETTLFDEKVFQLLDELFGDVDAFCADPEELAALQAELPGFYLDEQTLRGRVSDIAQRLSEM
jgi:hypothetical protein